MGLQVHFTGNVMEACVYQDFGQHGPNENMHVNSDVSECGAMPPPVPIHCAAPAPCASDSLCPFPLRCNCPLQCLSPSASKSPFPLNAHACARGFRCMSNARSALGALGAPAVRGLHWVHWVHWVTGCTGRARLMHWPSTCAKPWNTSLPWPLQSAVRGMSTQRQTMPQGLRPSRL